MCVRSWNSSPRIQRLSSENDGKPREIASSPGGHKERIGQVKGTFGNSREMTPQKRGFTGSSPVVGTQISREKRHSRLACRRALAQGSGSLANPRAIVAAATRIGYGPASSPAKPAGAPHGPQPCGAPHPPPAPQAAERPVSVRAAGQRSPRTSRRVRVRLRDEPLDRDARRR